MRFLIGPWGKHKENGIWLASVRRRKLMWRGHDAVYLAAGRLRIRIMKPSANRNYTNARFGEPVPKW